MIKLIAFIDRSIYAKSVCDHAAWIAGTVNGSVDLIHVLGRRNESEAPVDLSGSIGLGARTALLEELAELDGQVAKLKCLRNISPIYPKSLKGIANPSLVEEQCSFGLTKSTPKPSLF